ncbi:uncharacterized protein LOC143587235 [Bidens hawaiensis]|uniref:uncharacterized protein LOC143587235 n=1 Tax=Bidens hawaiensis TaxID=980011 RepID=UPI004049016B
MEAFSVMIRRGCDAGVTSWFKLPNNGPLLSHLLFADDVIIVGEWSASNIRAVGHLFRVFKLLSGLNINLQKSLLYEIEVNVQDVKMIADLLHCKLGDLPFIYLEIKVGANISKSNNWQPVIDIFDKRLASWKVHTLFMGGRLMLIKSVLVGEEDRWVWGGDVSGCFSVGSMKKQL